MGRVRRGGETGKAGDLLCVCHYTTRPHYLVGWWFPFCVGSVAQPRSLCSALRRWPAAPQLVLHGIFNHEACVHGFSRHGLRSLHGNGTTVVRSISCMSSKRRDEVVAKSVSPKPTMWALSESPDFREANLVPLWFWCNESQSVVVTGLAHTSSSPLSQSRNGEHNHLRSLWWGRSVDHLIFLL